MIFTFHFYIPSLLPQVVFHYAQFVQEENCLLIPITSLVAFPDNSGIGIVKIDRKYYFLSSRLLFLVQYYFIAESNFRWWHFSSLFESHFHEYHNFIVSKLSKSQQQFDFSLCTTIFRINYFAKSVAENKRELLNQGLQITMKSDNNEISNETKLPADAFRKLSIAFMNFEEEVPK